MNHSRFGLITLCLLASCFVATSFAHEPECSCADKQQVKRADVNKTLSNPKIRGGIVYKAYCVLCHGESGNGQSKAAKLYNNSSLVIGKKSAQYYDKIIREGGKALGKSPFMPPWNNELSEEQIEDVISYLSLVSDGAKRGEVVFKTNCILCHGVNGDGKGRASRLYNPPPADLTRSDKNDDYKRMIITLGGKAMGRSEFMPVWGDQLTPAEIDDAVAYIGTLVIK